MSQSWALSCHYLRPLSVDSWDDRFFPPASAVEGIKSVLSVCVCVRLLVSALPAESSYFYLSSGRFHFFSFLPTMGKNTLSELVICGLTENPISWLTSLQIVVRWTIPSCTYFICKETITSILKIPDPSVWQLGLFSIVKFWSHTLGLGNALTCHF